MPIDTHSFLVDVVVILAAGCLIVPITKRLGFGSILGYLLAGAILGPQAIGLFSNPANILSIAEIGVVLLLFVIGLELNLTRLWQMRRLVFGLGQLQVGICAIGMSLLVYNIFQISAVATVLVGVTLALSSTAFAMQLLQESNEHRSPHGETSFAILLFQDLVAIPLLAIVPLLGSQGEIELSGFLRAGLAILGIVVIGRLLLRPVFRYLAQVRIKEVFTGATLLLVVGVAVLMHSVGLSMALGSFLAGVLLADSEYKHEIEADIEPFKGLFLGLFFIAVGMSAQLQLLWQEPLLIISLSIGMMLIKLIGVQLATGLCKHSRETSRNTAFAIIQGGEFAFVIFGLAGHFKLIPESNVHALVLAVSLSMALTPLTWFLNTRFLRKIGPNSKAAFDKNFDERDPHVLIAGFGRVGQVVARVLRLQKIPFSALDHSPEQIELVRRFGNKVYYGDASRLDLLTAAGAERAKVIVVAIDDVEASLATVDMVKKHFPHLRILARARNRSHVFQLMERNVEQIQRETFLSSLKMTESLLLDLGYEEQKIKKLLDRFQLHDEEMLNNQFRLRHDQAQMISFSRESANQLEQVLKDDSSNSLNSADKKG